MFAHTLNKSQVILDTNVALDLWLFHQSSVLVLAESLGAGHLEAVATMAMRDELQTVLTCSAYGRGVAPRWSAHTAAATVLAAWDAATLLVPDPGLTTASSTPRCTDPDDQKFIDLAWASRVPWLLTRDRAVLRLNKRLRAQGVSVATPETWQASQA
jgi:uncharacterized protein